MLPGEVAPATKVVREAEVWGAEVGRRHDDGRAAPQAPEDVVHAPELVAGAAGAATPKQRAAQAGRVPPVSEYVQVPISAGTTTFDSEFETTIASDKDISISKSHET